MVRKALATWVAVLGLVALTAVAPAGAIPSQDPLAYDAFDAVTFNDEAQGVEVPYTSNEEFYETSPTFDNSTYTLEAGEAGPVNHTGCLVGGGEVSFAGRTAWVRFDPDVDGRLIARAITPGYDSVLIVHQAADRPWGQTDFSHLQSVDCSDTPSPGNETIGACFPDGIEVACGSVLSATNTYFVQVGGKCPGAATPCDTGVPSGSTRIEIRFVPADSDGDGVADTNDACVDVPGDLSADGCPDQDQDGVADAEDDCVDQPGVGADHPYNGCPEGPLPPVPPGEYKVLIRSLDGSYLNTNQVNVLLELNWKKGATAAFVDNGAGDEPQMFTLATESPTIAWELAALEGPSASETRSVNVRFTGPGIDEVARDDITLDSKDPSVLKKQAYYNESRTYLAVRARDDGTGIRRIQVRRDGTTVAQQSMSCPGGVCPGTAELLERIPGPRPTVVRITDGAGNTRRVNLKIAEQKCPQPDEDSEDVFFVLEAVGSGFDCFGIGDRCRRKAHLWELSDQVACRRVGDVRRVRRK